ncbi:hypothetical protein K458DRAFT_397397 [Lentithecium fluviatile CBS 122367]|uniref:Uncharacterized protein n=1 Tax=Lentithecium fluviatile CBS 122367 TaxID=1168545 RepID=A0A6G1ID78_9PLEO|nr:hypothetical protein K458DRAFT_397397 [Lentithecium fluviatile CBS 122367]
MQWFQSTRTEAGTCPVCRHRFWQEAIGGAQATQMHGQLSATSIRRNRDGGREWEQDSGRDTYQTDHEYKKPGAGGGWIATLSDAEPDDYTDSDSSGGDGWTTPNPAPATSPRNNHPHHTSQTRGISSWNTHAAPPSSRHPPSHRSNTAALVDTSQNLNLIKPGQAPPSPLYDDYRTDARPFGIDWRRMNGNPGTGASADADAGAGSAFG